MAPRTASCEHELFRVVFVCARWAVDVVHGSGAVGASTGVGAAAGVASVIKAFKVAHCEKMAKKSMARLRHADEPRVSVPSLVKGPVVLPVGRVVPCTDDRDLS